MALETLVYVDPSPRGEWALGLLELLPAEFLREICLIATGEDVQDHPGLIERARQRLERAGAGSVRELVAAGPAERAVAGAVQAGACGLLVVPPAGRNALQRMLKGSRVAAIVRSVRAPVLVARRPPARLERILAAVSGHASTLAVADFAARLGAALGARVSYLHVASEVVLPYGAGQPAPSREAEALRQLRARLARSGHEAHLLSREGLAVDEVLEEFESGAHQLLVLGGQGEHTEPAWAREDVTERLLLRCPGSTLIVPA